MDKKYDGRNLLIDEQDLMIGDVVEVVNIISDCEEEDYCVSHYAQITDLSPNELICWDIYEWRFAIDVLDEDCGEKFKKELYAIPLTNELFAKVLKTLGFEHHGFIINGRSDPHWNIVVEDFYIEIDHSAIYVWDAEDEEEAYMQDITHKFPIPTYLHEFQQDLRNCGLRDFANSVANVFRHKN